MVKEWQSQSPDLNPIQILCKDLSKQFIGGNPPTSQFKWSCTKEWAKTPTCHQHLTDQHLQETLPSVAAAKGYWTRYWKQRFTYFCNAQICNTGSFSGSQNIFLSLVWFGCLCLLSGLLMIFWVIFMQKYKILKGSQTFEQHYIYIYIYIYIVGVAQTSRLQCSTMTL